MLSAPLATLTFIFLAATTYSWSQPCLNHPVEPDATLLGSFTATAELDRETTGEQEGDFSLEGGESYRTQFEVCVWRTAEGKVEYVVSAGTVRLSGTSGAGIDAITTASIFDAIASAAVRQGAALGYGDPAAGCDGGNTVRVYMESCVSRHGSGTLTSFLPCDGPVWYSRSFAVCALAVTPVAPVPSSADYLCAPGCESTCR